MSQIYKPLSSSGPIPPIIPTSFTTDIGSNPDAAPGTAIPAGNNLEILGRATVDDDPDGIRTDADPNGGKFLYVELTNRFQGSVDTTDATPTTVITFDASALGTYIFELKASAYNETDILGSGFSLFSTVRSNGTDTFLCGTPDKIANKEAGMELTDVNVVVGGLGNTNVFFQVTGLAGKTITWCCVGLYCLSAP